MYKLIFFICTKFLNTQMHEIILVRHAKSDWGNEFLKDIDRPLNQRGYDAAYVASNWFLTTKNMPNLMLSSTATRALNTALIFARTLNFNMTNFVLQSEVYESSENSLIDIISKLQNQNKTVMLFGHNPSITNVCNKLSNDLFFDNVPTCGIVSLLCDINNWADIKTTNAKLNYHQFPKNYKNNN